MSCPTRRTIVKFTEHGGVFIGYDESCPAQTQKPAKAETRKRSVMEKKNQESHPSSIDECLLPFVESLVDKFVGSTEKNEALTDPNPAPQRIHIIERVPDELREQNENAYSPTTISIGPIHRGTTQRLQPMEAVKLSYMFDLFKRTGEVKETIEACATALLKLEAAVRIRKCYQPTKLQHLDYFVGIVEVILIDAGFIIELLYRNYKNYYDPILCNPFKFYAIQRDLLLLENQIPFFVLEILFNLTVAKIPNQSDQHQHSTLPKLVLSFFGNMMSFETGESEKYRETGITTPCHHILHLFHIYYLQRVTTNNPSCLTYEERTGIKYSATQLGSAGIKLLKAVDRRNLFDISFRKAFSCTSCLFLYQRGYLEIPPFSVSESTESFLTNLIAFEQINQPEIDTYFTSLAFFMNILLQAPEDVKLFEEAGIVRNYLGSKEEVVRLFNGIFKKAIPRRFHYHEQYKAAIDFHKAWRVSGGWIKQNYFGNPWSGISIYAAIVLFFLTFLPICPI